MAAEGNGNLKNWLAGISIAVALLLSGFGAITTLVKDTPTRAEMERKISEAEARASGSNTVLLHEIVARMGKLDEIDRRLSRIEGRLGVIQHGDH